MFAFEKVALFHNVLLSPALSPISVPMSTKLYIYTNIVLTYRFCVMKLTERLKQEGIDINLRDALGVDTDPKLRNLRGKL